MTDPVDQMWVEGVREFDGKRLQSIATSQVDMAGDEETEDDEPDRDQQREDFAPLLSWLTETLQEQAKEVRLSSRLTTSPACLVGDAHDITPAMDKMYRAMEPDVPQVKRIFELNPTHPLVIGLRTAHEQRTDDPTLPETAELLHGTALLAEGGDLSNPARFTRILADRLARTL